ncbi:MAG: aromatic amino acid transport family protein [Legionellaceae bacterium]|nr:aromatic amino acid transport family protein [Legionellaceae bacterium]
MSSLKTFNAVLMITGTSVGTGILGLPIVTSSAGFVPSIIAFIISWVFMTAAALHILEIKMQVRGNYNLSSMIKITMGKSGQVFSSLIIVLLLYALLCTYMMAGSAWLRVLLASTIKLSDFSITVIFTLIFSLILYCGERLIYNINNFLAFCLMMAFFMTISVSVMPPNYDFINQINYQAIYASFPLLLTTFGFSIIVPAVTEYLEYDKKSAKFAILAGGIIALIAYVIWEWVILGHVALHGKNSFQELKQAGDNGTGVILAFAASANSSLVNLSGRIFAIFAAITSFMGVSVALIHFLADNLKLEARGGKRLLLLIVIYIPPLLITSMVPNAFVQVLGFAGIFVAVLLGLFPVLMIYNNSRKNTSLNSFGYFKKIFLFITALFFVGVIIIEILNLAI